MKWTNIRAKELNTVINKLGLVRTESRRGREPGYYYWLDGKRQLRVTLPNIHGGSGSISRGFLHQIRKALGLSSQELLDLVNCPLTGEGYEAIIRTRLNLSR